MVGVSIEMLMEIQFLVLMDPVLPPLTLWRLVSTGASLSIDQGQFGSGGFDGDVLIDGIIANPNHTGNLQLADFIRGYRPAYSFSRSVE